MVLEALDQELHDFYEEHQVYSQHKNKWNAVTPETRRLYDKSSSLLEKIDTIKEKNSLSSQEKLFLNDMRAAVKSINLSFSIDFKTEPVCFDDMLSLYGDIKPDIDNLEPWLLENKDKIQEELMKDFGRIDATKQEDSLIFNIPQFRDFAISHSTIELRNVHHILGKLIEDVSGISEFAKECEVHPFIGRSYCNSIHRYITLNISQIYHMEKNKSIKMDKKEMFRIYGHEGRGHLLNSLLTDGNKDIPKFLKRYHTVMTPVSESVAQHFQKMIFEDLNDNPDVQKELEISDSFKDIYESYKSELFLDEFVQKRSYYMLYTFARSDLKPEEKIERICAVAHNNHMAYYFRRANQKYFDQNGNLIPDVANEMVYVAEPVKKALGTIASHLGEDYYKTHRKEVDKFLLTGFWTPQSFIERTRLFVKDELNSHTMH